MIRILAVCLMWVASGAWAGNLLINPGFESGSLAGWTVTGAPSGVDVAGAAIPGPDYASSVAVRSGSYAAWGVVRGACCTTPESVTFSQTVSVEAGEDYSIGFYLDNQSERTVGYALGDAENSLQIFVNGVGLFSQTTLCPGGCLDPALGWYSFSGTVNSGASTSMTVAFRFIASGTSSVGLSADDFYVVGAPVPEPGTLSLMTLALGGLALRLRLSRRS